MKITLKEDILSHLIEVALRADIVPLLGDVPELIYYGELKDLITLDESDINKAKTIARYIKSSKKRLEEDLYTISNRGLYSDEHPNPFINEFAQNVRNTLLYKRKWNGDARRLIYELVSKEFHNDCEVEDVIRYCLYPFIFQQWLEKMTALNAQHIREVQIALSGVKDIRDIKMSDLPDRTNENGVFIEREVV